MAPNLNICSQCSAASRPLPGQGDVITTGNTPMGNASWRTGTLGQQGLEAAGKSSWNTQALSWAGIGGPWEVYWPFSDKGR